MEALLLNVFKTELRKQCEFALMASSDIDISLAQNDRRRLWYSAQSYFMAVGNVSKMLWPIKNRSRGEELRLTLGVEESSILRLRTFRDHFEHYDERLESWFTSSSRHNSVESSVGPRESISGIDVKDFLRHYDPATKTISFRGDEYPLQPVIDAIKGLQLKIGTS